uniref:Uncharacterized protein n=1 Tax=Ralstonia solanacearum TaxID=305 RepID=A0A0S4VS81_RALSL|nr:protein of unknown function [Ralstonia solanacearum]
MITQKKQPLLLINKPPGQLDKIAPPAATLDYSPLEIHDYPPTILNDLRHMLQEKLEASAILFDEISTHSRTHFSLIIVSPHYHHGLEISTQRILPRPSSVWSKSIGR